MEPANIPWYKSSVLRAVALIVVTRILARFHLDIPGVAAADIVDTALDLATLGGAIWAAYARVKHPLPAITTTQTKADIANALPTPSPSPAVPPSVQQPISPSGPISPAP